MADKLLPCPFCGGEARILTDMQDTTTPVFSVVCDECESITYFGDVLDKEGTVEAWNNRPSPWHTGTPTKEGLYAVYYWDDHNPSATPYEVLYDGFLSPDGEGNWIDRDGEIRFIDDDIVRWQKIEPYKEASK